MSEEPKVWVSILDYEYVNIYSIGANFPNFFDYPDFVHTQSEVLRRRELEECKNSPELAELRRKNKELSSSGLEINRIIRSFRKTPCLPDSLWLQDARRELPKPSEYMFKIQGGGLVLNEACATVLKQFNLGESTLTPLKIHKLFTDELWLEDTFYFFNLCERREYVVVPQPNDKFEYHSKNYPSPFYNTFHEMEDNMLVVNQSATQCDVDIWHDPLFQSSYFLSDRLYQAFLQAGMHEKWNAHCCHLS